MTSVQSVRPSDTERGRAWLKNFATTDRYHAQLLLDTLQVKSPSEVFHGLKESIEAITPTFGGSACALIPVLSFDDIDSTVATKNLGVRTSSREPVRHVAYVTFNPGAPLLATPGSEAAVGTLVRDFTGSQPGRERGQWLHPGSQLETLATRRCEVLLLITDYIGSGQQVIEFAATFTRNARIRSWRSFARLQIIVVAYAASSAGRKAVEACKHVDALFVNLPASSFSDAAWTQKEREAIEALCLSYTPRKQQKEALGYGASAGLFFTHTAVPNNLPFILRRSTKGWRAFLPGRKVPADLAKELGDYARPHRDLASAARSANQARLARAIESGRLTTSADTIVITLALIAHSRHTRATLAHQLALPDAQIAAIIEFLQDADFVDAGLSITARGRVELRHARRLDRVATARLRGQTEAYYPLVLR